MTDHSSGRPRLTGWAALIGGFGAYLNVVLVVSVTGQDTNLIYHGASMLSLSGGARDLFRWGMLADILGFYLPFVFMSTYLWASFRKEAGMLGDVAALMSLAYVVFGMTGAGFQQAVLNPLAQLHAGGDDAVKAAAEAAWTAVVYGCQKGIWWCEGPVIFVWGLVVARLLRSANWGRWFVLILQIIAWVYGLFFVSGFFAALNDLTDLLETIGVLLFPLWMIWFGVKLLRRSAAQEAGQ
jgi:hypothetical protein